ncbi:MAG TPA: ABC transporter substrate-binding protein, partial [Bdellovibrio sp.]|nr:ABC transporter substrate-binding protein [Bdellovibrio sp.]
MNFPKEIDPAHILSMADLEVSVALASPLVTFDQERQITAALAEKWEIIPPKTIQFKLRKDLVWSDGTPVLAEHFRLSLERAKHSYPNDLKALFDAIESISATDATTLRITTSTDVQKSGILLKLTEPMYGLLSVKNGKIDLSKTSGPFLISKQTDNEVVLKAN